MGRRSQEQVTMLLCDRQLLAGQCGHGREPVVKVLPMAECPVERGMEAEVQKTEGRSHI